MYLSNFYLTFNPNHIITNQKVLLHEIQSEFDQKKKKMRFNPSHFYLTERAFFCLFFFSHLPFFSPLNGILQKTFFSHLGEKLIGEKKKT